MASVNRALRIWALISINPGFAKLGNSDQLRTRCGPNATFGNHGVIKPPVVYAAARFTGMSIPDHGRMESMIRVLLVAAALSVPLLWVLLQVAVADAPYPNCKATAADGRCNIPSNDPVYGPWLDRDHDGIGCEC